MKSSPPQSPLLDCLVTRNLSHNYLSGQPPKGLGRLAKLQMVDLSVNMLSGAFTASEDGFQAIEVVNVSFCQFTGPLPAFLGAMNLTVLYISINGVSGGISTTALCVEPVRTLCFSGNGIQQ
jgi:Leucine-rich repeat (LRR) protein